MQGMLEGGDRTVGLGEGSLKVCEDLVSRPMGRLRPFPGRQFRRRTQAGECGADLALAKVEAFPDALQTALAKMALGGVHGRGKRAMSSLLEKPPQAAGGQAEPADLVGAKDAEGPSAAWPLVAVAAKDPASAAGFLPGLFIKAAQKAVPNESADRPAMGTRHQLEPLCHGGPISVIAAKPLLHESRLENRDCTGTGKQRGRRARYEMFFEAGCGVNAWTARWMPFAKFSV
jgi:hypothetical protein